MKRIITILLVLSVVATALFADALDTAKDNVRTSIRARVTPKLEDLAKEIGSALPDNAVIGSTWSDAYIGQIIGIPPHFGIGVSTGVTKFSISCLKDAFKTAFDEAITSNNVSIPGNIISGDTMVLPTYTISAKIGGFILPFDAGIRLSYIPQVDDLLWTGLSFNYLIVGADLRYNIIEQGIVTPDFSIGASYTYLSGNIGLEADTNNGIIVDYTSHILEVSAQVSKSFIVVTPYIGAGCIFDWTNVDVTTRYSASYGGYSFNDKFTVPYSRDSSEMDDDFFTARIFGGTSLNLAILKIDLCGSYNFITQNWGGNIGVRVQL